MFGRSMFREMEEDSFFTGARDHMRGWDNFFERDPFKMPANMLEDGRGRENRDDRRGSRDQERTRDVAPFDPNFGFGNMFESMNNMMRGVQENMNRSMRAFESSASDPNAMSYQQSSFMSYSNTGDGPPKVYQAQSSTRRAPGGVRETRKALRDSEAAVEKMAVGHHIHDRGHVVEKHKNTRTGDVDERQNYLNIEETEAPQFDAEFRDKARQYMNGNRLDYDRRRDRGHDRERDRYRDRPVRREERKALPPSRTEHWGRSSDGERYRDRD